MGAGKPTTLDIPNGLARGVRTASDFLMALQLTGAAQARLDRQHAAAAAGRRDRRRPHRDRHRDRVARLLRGAGREVPRTATRRSPRRSARTRSATAGTPRSARSPRSSCRTPARSAASGARRARRARPPRIAELLQPLGRRDDRLPPAADRQPVVHAEPRGGREGARGRRRVRRGPDAARGRRRRVRRGAGRSASRRQRRGDDGEVARGRRDRGCRPRTVFVAAGTQPNTVLAREDAAHFALDGKYFRACDEDGKPVKPAVLAREAGARRRAAVARRRRPLRLVLRRPAPVVLRQRGEGAGLDQAGLPGGHRACSRKRPPADAGADDGVLRARSTASCARPCTR